MVAIINAMFIKLYFIALTVFLAIDMVWLTLIAKGFYAKQLGYVMAKNPNLVAALTFYVIFIAGLVFFVIAPSLDKKMWMHAVFTGAFFGLVTYATYDLTNLATIRDWPLVITIIDMIWGTILSASVSGISFFIARKLGI